MLKDCQQGQSKCANQSRFSPKNFAMDHIKKDPKAQAIFLAAVSWSLAWKGFSLWRAAKNDSKPWFVTLLLTNSLGLLDAFYIFVVDRHGHQRQREINAIFAEADEVDDL